VFQGGGGGVSGCMCVCVCVCVRVALCVVVDFVYIPYIISCVYILYNICRCLHGFELGGVVSV